MRSLELSPWPAWGTSGKEVNVRHVPGGISPSLAVHTCPGSGNHRLGEAGRGGGTTAGRGGEGTDSGLGENTCGRQLGPQGWREGRGQPSLPAGFLGGGALAGALPQGIFVVAAAAPAPAVPAADAAHARDAVTAAGHVAAAHRAGPEAVAAAAARAADDGCGGTAGAAPQGRGPTRPPPPSRSAPSLSPWRKHPKNRFPQVLPSQMADS